MVVKRSAPDPTGPRPRRDGLPVRAQELANWRTRDRRTSPSRELGASRLRAGLRAKSRRGVELCEPVRRAWEENRQV